MIQFPCECGKILRAADEHAGKRARCKECGNVMSIPGARPAEARTPAPVKQSASTAKTTTSPKVRASSSLEDQAPSHLYELDEKVDSPPARAQRGRPCPNCSKPLPSRDATFCVDCGYNLTTGKKSSVDVSKPKKPKKPKASKVGNFVGRRLTSSKFLGGLCSLTGGTIWLVVGLMAGRLFFYPLFLIGGGVLSVFAGLIGGDD